MIAPLKARLAFLQDEGVRRVLLYYLFVFILFAALALVDGRLSALEIKTHYLFLLGITVLVGIFNAWVVENKVFLEESVENKAFLTFSANLLGFFFFVLLSRKVTFSHVPHHYLSIYLPALSFFSLPWFFFATVRAIMAIPALAFDPIHIGSLRDIVAEHDWTEDESRGIIWVFCDDFFEKDERGTYHLRTHTPLNAREIKLEELFKSLLSLHNHNINPGHPIYFREGEALHGWQFHHYPYWWAPRRPRALDPEKSLRRNRVRFRRLALRERENLKGLRSGLPRKFRVARIYITRPAEAVKNQAI